ncbi:hypothetical protein WJX73_002205 [Symbiochloris irregularis]|uniref:Uncharacterized protein n=1 Tax=Symbiochloris irregularis TaxID=706552 RepID=A0AAW1Q343_9CHLO
MTPSPSKKRTEQPSDEGSKANGKHGADESAKQEGPPPAKKGRLEVDKAPKDVLEEGRIYFFYRPRVGFESVSNLGEIQRFYMILSPGGDAKKSPNRLVVIGKKRLPQVEKHEKFFGFVEAKDADLQKLTESLGSSEYDTATVGTRKVEPCRAVGEGVYTIVQRGPRNTNLVFKLELPTQQSDARKELSIPDEGSYGLSIKNPKKGDPNNVGLDNKADYPAEQQDKFQGYAWLGAIDPTMLDHQNCEMLLIAASTDVEGELGKEVEEHLKAAASKDKQQAEGSDDSALIQKLRDELASEKAQVSTKPLETGKVE